jgi:hypothetical protein
LDWIALLGAVGVGAIVATALDALWVQRVLRESERQKWLRSEKLRVYAALSRDFMRLRGWDEWETLRDAATEAMLLEEDPATRARVVAHVGDIKQARDTARERHSEITMGPKMRFDRRGKFLINPAENARHEERKPLLLQQHQEAEANERKRLLSDARVVVEMLRLSLMRR